MPKDTIDDIDYHLEHIQREFNSKVESFVEFYNEAREEAKLVLGDLFSEADYPENIRYKFRFDWRFLLLDVPHKASVLSPDILEREKLKFQALMDEARDLSMAALREEFQEIVHHMVERLSENGNGNGRPKTFKSNMMSRINEFLDSFGDRNLFADAKLTELVDQARAVLQGVANPYALTFNEVMRQRFSQDMTALQSAIDESIEELPRRRIRIAPEPQPLAA